MKEELIKTGIIIAKGFLSCIYFLLKKLPQKEKSIVFCSRQKNDIPLDFILLQQKLKEKDNNIQCVNICCHVKGGKDVMRFAIAILKSMYYMAISKVCILDSYWPIVSILKHRESFTVIQIWHAIGKIKQSGYQSVGKISGRKEIYAKLLNMHKNYDYIIAGSEAWNEAYCQSFGVDEDVLLNYGLPRIDYIIDTKEKNREVFFKQNPELVEKKIILYVPTFRRNMKSNWDKIINAVDTDKYALIIKTHPGEQKKAREKKQGIYYFDHIKSIDLLSVSDYVITDYSAISLEAAVLGKKTYYWTYDYDAYIQNNGLNFDIKKELSGNVYDDINELMDAIDKGIYDMDAFQNYRKKYLPKEMGKATEKIANLVIARL